MKSFLLASVAAVALLAGCATNPNNPAPTGSFTNITQVVISATIAACGFQPIAGPALNAVISAAFGAAPAAGVSMAVDMLCKAAPLLAAAPDGTQSRRVRLPTGKVVIVKGVRR